MSLVPPTEERRGPGRPPKAGAPREGDTRTDDSLARAAARSREIRDTMPTHETQDKYWIDPNLVPEGFTYAWRRAYLMGQQERVYQNDLIRRGWQAVPQDRHPDWIMEMDGMILMELPTELVKERRAKLDVFARQQVRISEHKLGISPDGTMKRHLSKVDKEYARIPKEHAPVEIED